MTVALCTLMGLNSCQREGLFDPEKDPEKLPSMDGYFDFNTVESQTLKVNYNIPGYKASFAVYTENPVVYSEGERRLKEGVFSVFEAYTDDNCNYEGYITLPVTVEKVYIYSDYMFVPQCVEVEIVNNQICFSADAEETGLTKAASRAFEVTPNLIDAPTNLYALYNWGKHGSLPKGYVTETVSTITNGQKVGDLFKRLQSKLGETSTPTKKQNNSSLVSTEEYTNITVSPESADGKKIEGANIDLVYLNERAGYKSTLGYYYYKTEDFKKGLDIKKLPKYIIFPNVSQKNDDPYTAYKGDYSRWNAPLERGMKVRLQFFGEDGAGQAEDVFPAGYTIGWFIVANAYTLSEDYIDTKKDFYYSNVSANKNGESRCITLFDKKTQKVVVGFEDGEDESYEDILFYVDANPIEAIVDPENPDVPSIDDEDKPIVIPDKINTAQGTLAFEDIWPSGGDYDMNDVILEYKIQVTFDANNKIKKITETFVPVHDGALFANAFGYQVPQELDVQDAAKEAGQNLPTYIIFQNVKESVKAGTPYTIIRSFENNPIVFKVNGQETTDAATIFKQYNPFIVPKYVAGNQIRSEVHLPKHKGTALVDESLIGSRDDAYYLDRSGAYPFAIQLPVTGFKPATEKVRIDSDDEYPDFRKWADSKGKEAMDWYLNYQNK